MITKTSRLLLLAPYILAAFFWEGVRFLWFVWNLGHILLPRPHTKAEVYFIMWHCQWPGLTEAMNRVEDILYDDFEN
jgi:hypothetical protein